MQSAGPMLSNGFCDRAIYSDPLWNHTLAESPQLIGQLQMILSAGAAAMSFHEAVNLYRIGRRTNKLPGDIAEVGVFHGGSALIMELANEAQKRMHLFDTFAGIPETSAGIDLIKVGDIKGSPINRVRALLDPYNERVDYHVGIFPNTAAEIPPTTQFALVNLDMDVYQSTKAGFEYFYPRMSRGGAIICHDYCSKSCPGVRKAVDEFLADKPETPVDLWHTQVVIIKM